MVILPTVAGTSGLDGMNMTGVLLRQKRLRAKCVVLLLCPFSAPLSHEITALPMQCPTTNTFNSKLFKDLPSEIAVFGFQFSHLAMPARAFLRTSHAIAQFFYKFSSPLFVALSTGYLGPSWGRLGVVLACPGAVPAPAGGLSCVSL